MKRFICILLTALFVVSLCSCKETNTDNLSSESEYVETIIIEEDSEESSKTESTDNSKVESQPSQPSQTASSNVDTSSTQTKIKTLKDCNLIVDSARVPGTDVGSSIENGYVYYTRSDGSLCKQPLGGGSAIVLPIRPDSFKVLNNNIYCLSKKKLYCCDTRGENVRAIDESGTIERFEVAGKWLFVEKNNTYDPRYKYNDLYVMSIDGSQKHQIKPETEITTASTITIHGFSRGYCYLSVSEEYISAKYPSKKNNIATVSKRIDYRSNTFAQEDFDPNIEYTNDNGEIKSSEIGSNSICNDYILIGSYAISMIDSSKISLKEGKEIVYVLGGAGRRCLGNYFVDMRIDNTNGDKIIFIDKANGRKEVPFDIPSSDFSSKTSYLNGYSLVDTVVVKIERDNPVGFNSGRIYSIYAVTPNGSVVDLYHSWK